MRIFPIVVASVIALGACGFSADVPPDASGPAIEVGFAKATSEADEKSTAHKIEVRLSEASDKDVTVKYEIAGGTATPGADFEVTTAEVVIPAGELASMLVVDVKADTDGTEADETIDLVLSEATNATIAAAARSHEVLIHARALPRVSFEQAMSSAQEPTDGTFNIVLDELSEFDITASYTVTSTNATSGEDYVLADGTVLIPANTMSVPLTLDVLDDDLDEDDESVIVTLTTSTNALVDDTKAEHAHTILDDLVDPPPTVGFAAASATVAEGAGSVTVAVTLSAVSGRTITVPYALNAASTATGGGTDFTLVGTSLTIPPGQPGGSITVTIVQDTTDEPNETIQIDMGMATHATNAGQQTHTLTIADDDLVCYGAAPFAVCLDSPPTGAQTLPSSINTQSSTLCAAAQPTGWTTAPQSQPAACFVLKDTITVNGTVTVTGNRPLVLVGATSITVTGTLDASSNNLAGSTGPAAPSADCDAFGANPASSANGGGGGAGGTFVTKGGDGGTGNNGGSQAGTAPAAEATPIPTLRAGCHGQRGGNGANSGSEASGQVGRGGGAVYLVTGGTLTLAATAVINVSGSGGLGGGRSSGGSGAGSGGMAKLYAATLAATAGAKVMANGGGGASGGDNNTDGVTGQDPDPATPTTPALGGDDGTGDTGAVGGDGYAGATAATSGVPAGATEGGGGGGGGGGYVQSNLALTNVTVSAGVVQVP